MFKHFIITRFNLRYEDIHKRDKRGKATTSTQWLDDRFKLFTNYCFASVKGQRNKDFTWLVLFDKDTPEVYKAKIAGFEKAFSNFNALYLENGEPATIKRHLNSYIALQLTGLTKYIITTRIDNDDAFHEDMVDEVQSLFKEQPDVVLNFDYGFQYDINKRVLVKIKYEMNHFTSRIEKYKGEIESIIIHDHTLIHQVVKMQTVNNALKPLWIETIHDANLSNRLRITKPVFSSSVLSKFHIKGGISFKQTMRIYRIYIQRALLKQAHSIVKKMGLLKPAKSIKKLFLNK